jgi:phospholipid/cholesterol/gamma-HCH transport system substrate-binding protein
MNEQAMKFRFGIFVLASLILLAVLVMLFGGLPRYFVQNDAYTIVVDNALGVSSGTPVRRSGVKIGEVRTVELDSATGKVTLSILIDHKYTLRKSDRAVIARNLLGGDTSVDFLPPEDPRKIDVEPVEPGTVLQGTAPPEAPELVQKAGELLTPARDAMVELTKILNRVDKMMPVMEETLKEFRGVAKATNQLVPELGKTNEELRELTRTARQTMPELKKAGDEFQVTARIWGKLGERLDVLFQTNEAKLGKIVDQLEESTRSISELLNEENRKNVNVTLKNMTDATRQLDTVLRNTDDLIKEGRVTIKNLNGTVQRLDGVIFNLDKAIKPLGESTPKLLQSLEDSSTSINRMIGDVRDLMRDLARSDGTLQRLVTDPSLYHNLNESACMVTRVLPRLDRILADMEIFADKLARHPEAIGLGGVVRPGNGLKEAPSVLPWREPTEPRWRIWH